MDTKWKNLLLGPNKYTTGLVFLLANVMGFFAKMKENNMSQPDTFTTLFMVVLVAYALS